MGHSGGASHALACAALLGERVLAVAGVSGLAPCAAAPVPQDVTGEAARGQAGRAARAADDFDWFAGMAPSCEASCAPPPRGGRPRNVTRPRPGTTRRCSPPKTMRRSRGSGPGSTAWSAPPWRRGPAGSSPTTWPT
ncbi:hypothetical protein ACFQ0B_29470 [Nonomuraea thailandensis]